MRAFFWSVLVLCLISSHQAGVKAEPPPDPKYKLVLQAPPATAVDSVTVSPDGSLVATAAGEGGVRLYNAKTGTLLRALGDVGDRGVVFSPDGKKITAAGFHMDKLVGVYDVQTGQRVLALPGHTEWEAYATALSPDGKLLASTGTDKQILVWELATGKLRHQLKDQPEKIASLAFSPDSTTLISGGGDKLIRLWDIASGKLRRSFSGPSDWICTLAYSPDGKSIASGSCDWGFHRGHDWPRGGRGAEKCEWRLWDAGSGQLLRSEQNSGQMLSLAFAPDSKTLAVCVDKNLLLYDLSSETSGRVVTSHHATITSAAFTPDGTAIITGSHDHTAKRTSLTTGQTEWDAPGSFEHVNSIALSANGSFLVTGSSDHRFARGRLAASASELGSAALRLWDARTGRLLRRFGNSPDQILAVAISTDGKRIASGGASATGKGIARLWDSANGSLVWSDGENEKEVLALAFSPDGKKLATGAANGAVKLCDTDSGAVAKAFTGHEGGATSLAFSPDGKVIYCGEAPGSAKAWDVTTAQLLQTCKSAASKAELFTIDRKMNSIGLSRDGTTLATCGSSMNNEFVGSVKIWDARSGQLKRDFAAENIHGRPMALSPDGSIIATGGKSVRLWDVGTGIMLRELYGHLKRTQSIVFSADGRLIFAGGSYGTTNLWEVATGKHLATLFAFPDDQRGANTDDWLAYTPEGQFDGSPGAERYLAWRTGDAFQTAENIGAHPDRPTRVMSALEFKASR